jgi:hypothetical protein
MDNLDLIYKVGEVKRIAHKAGVSDGGDGSPTTFQVTAVTINIYDSTGALVVTAGAGGVDSASAAAEHEVYYLWTPSTAGKYTYNLFGVVGGQTLLFGSGGINVLAATSKFDKWVERTIDWMRENEAGEAQRILSSAQLRDAIAEAVREYSKKKPRRILKDAQALTAGDWDYTLWTEWEHGFSTLITFEYPLSTTAQERPYLNVAEDIWIDPDRSLFGFRAGLLPSTGETYRAVFTAPHTLDDSTDTVPAADYPSVAQYAAGVALTQAANLACQSEGQGTAADVVNYRSKQQEFSTQARRMMDDARRKWARVPNL